MEDLLGKGEDVICVAYVICVALIIWGMQDKSIVKSNVVLSALFYIAGLCEIFFCDVVFPVALIWLYAISVIVNYMVSKRGGPR